MARPSPCASCKLRLRGCDTDCIFAPYFPSDDPQKFFAVHKVFGAWKVNKLLEAQLRFSHHFPYYLLPTSDAVSSIVYEADAREADPVYGCARYGSGTNPYIQKHEVVKGEKGKEAFETAQEKEPSVFVAAGERKHEAAEKRILKFPFDLNEHPSDEDEDIMP
ncbi:hypothetical protein K1719_045717 [Acacia pycnantha]|nr:hypothetical protein K1719_045717 [Acacia pycnantha]